MQRILCSPPPCCYRWADDAVRPRDVTLAFNVACCPPPQPKYISGRYHRRPAVNSVGPHCYVIACSTVTHVKEVENEDLIHSATSLEPPPHTHTRTTSTLSIPPSVCLRSIYSSICLRTEVQWALATYRRRRAMDLGKRRRFGEVILISRNWEMTLGGGRPGQATELPCQSVKRANLI